MVMLFFLLVDDKNRKRRAKTALVTNAQTRKGYVNNYEKNRYLQKFATFLYYKGRPHVVVLIVLCLDV